MTARERILAALVDLENEVDVASTEAGCDIPIFFVAAIPRAERPFGDRAKDFKDGMELQCDPIFLTHGIKAETFDGLMKIIKDFGPTLRTELQKKHRG